MIQVDVYRLDRRLERSFVTDGAGLFSAISEYADRPVDQLANYVMGQVSILRVDLGRNGFAVLEHLC